MNTALLAIQQKLNSLWFYLYNPWTIYQLVIISVCFFVALRIAKYLEPSFENWVRAIKGNAGPVADAFRPFTQA